MSRKSKFHSARTVLTILIVAVGVNALGCADGEFRLGDPFDRELTLSEAQHKYTVYVRWNDFQNARSFVAPVDRDDYMLQMESLSEARITSYDSGPVELDHAKRTATINVTYTLYTAAIPYEFEITEVQEWSREGMGNTWSVLSIFDGLQQLASN
jgi:hypothetical protein